MALDLEALALVGALEVGLAWVAMVMPVSEVLEAHPFQLWVVD